MIKINLLPWREELRKQKQKDFSNALVAWIVFSGTVFAGIHFYFDNEQANQKQRNKILENEIAQLDLKIADIKNIEETKKYLINKITVIYDLQRSLPETVHLFHEITRVTPDDLFLTKLNRTARNLTFEGKSQSNAQISALMNSIESSQWLQLPTLDIIQSPKAANEKSHDFILHAKQRDLPETK